MVLSDMLKKPEPADRNRPTRIRGTQGIPRTWRQIHRHLPPRHERQATGTLRRHPVDTTGSRRSLLRSCSPGSGQECRVRPSTFHRCRDVHTAIIMGSSAQLPLQPPEEYLFAVFVMPTGVYHGVHAVDALVLEEFDRSAPEGVGHAKIGGNYSPVWRWSDKARKEGYNITLHLDSKTRSAIDEFSTSSFLGVKKGKDGQVTIVSPKSSQILDSITSASVCEIAESLGYTVEKRPVPYEELPTFDEVCAAGTAAALVPIKSITMKSKGDKFEYNNGSSDPGPVVMKLLTTLQASYIPRNGARASRWLPGLRRSRPPDRDERPEDWRLHPPYRRREQARVRAAPIQVMQFPSYGVIRGEQLSIHMRGKVYKELPLSRTSVKNLLRVAFRSWGALPHMSSLSPEQTELAQSWTKQAFMAPQHGLTVSGLVHFDPALDFNSVPFTLPPSDGNGLFDIWQPMNVSLSPELWHDRANVTTSVQIELEHGAAPNTTVYILPSTGLTIVSDIDDVLRDSRIFSFKKAIENMIIKPFVPWRTMPEAFKTWKDSFDPHFHYLTDLPDNWSTRYLTFLAAHFPRGTFDSRPLSLEHMSETVHHPRAILLNKLLHDQPNRSFVLVGDNNPVTVPSIYADAYLSHPQQIKCILIRYDRATDIEAPTEVKGLGKYKKIPRDKYMFFNVPEDIMALDFTRGDCRNSSVVVQGLGIG
ncbi:hypothetical protein MRB53_041727 [Persea americana]|nr:hypothetical protein MRB53_041727 [Persea americana]